MESLDKKTLIPSKRFIMAASVIVLAVFTFIAIQKDFAAHILKKKKSSPATDALSNKTIGSTLSKDSNGNGIADWEERLWGLDPTVVTTNGVSNKVLILQKKQALSGETTGETLNETDKVARDLFTLTSAVGQEEGTAPETLETIAEKLASESIQKNILPLYTVKNLSLVTTNPQTLNTYQNDLAKALTSYNDSLPEFEIVIDSIVSGDYTQLESLNETIAFYRLFAKKLLTIKTPKGIASYHLALTNSVAGLANALEKTKALQENGVSALAGIAEYQFFNNSLTEATEKITAYLEQYGILER